MPAEGAVMSEGGVAVRAAFAGAVPDEGITDDPRRLAGYCEDRSFGTGATAQLVVYPTRKEELQAIVRQANEHRLPLVPVSSGPPHFHGGSRPAHGGVVADFQRMNRILKVDATDRYVMIEPGVTYGELIPEVRKKGLRLDAPLLPRASKSVVASRLEREPVAIPKYQYDYSDPLMTVEVVYGDGTDFRTGSASGPGPLEQLTADKVNPWGPGAIDYLRFITGAQGTMGLVTWAVTKAEVLPSVQKLYFITTSNLGLLITFMNRLLRRRVGDECLALNNVGLAARLAQDWSGDFERLRGSLPEWTALVVLAGYKHHPEERLAIQERYLFEVCHELGVAPLTTLPGAEGREDAVLATLSEAYCREPYFKLGPRGSCRDIMYLSPPSKVADLAGIVEGLRAKHEFPRESVGAYLQPCVQGRGYHCEFELFCAEDDPIEMARVRGLFFDASEALMAGGAFFSRPYGPWSDMVYSRYGEGVAALRKLKGIFDPNNILNPGKLCF
ncbi:MAG TPA: FAD-binding oxidoreductase [Chloroflexota bacterium]|nr:FAD-binding oxidoreductase [Chloroflexota bacterium]